MDENGICFVPLAATFLIGLLTIKVIHWYSKWNHDYWRKRGIPYIEPVPFFGSILEIFYTPPPYFEMKRYLQHGPLYGYFERNRPCLSIADPKILKQVLVKDFPAFSTRRDFKANNVIYDNMISSVQGEKWKRIRNIVSPAFTGGKLRRMIGIIEECTNTLITNLKTAAVPGNQIDAKRMYGAFTMDVIASTAFSTKVDSHNNPDNKFASAANNVFKKRRGWRSLVHVLFPNFANLLRISIRPADIHFLKDMTLQIIEERKRTGQSRNDFLQLLLDTSKEMEDEEKLKNEQESNNEVKSINGDGKAGPQEQQFSKKPLTAIELVAQCVIFFLAGYDTTASTLSNVTYCMATNQHAQDRLRREVDKVMEQNKGELTYEILSEMKYLDNVISETLRMYPPVARIERIAASDYECPDLSFKIPKGMVISVPIYAIHRDPRHFPDPETFNPDRFNPEERANRDPYTYMPFSMGPRNCVAMRFAFLELKFCLVHVISAFVIKTCTRTKVPLEYAQGRGFTNPKEIIVSLEPREKRNEE